MEVCRLRRVKVHLNYDFGNGEIRAKTSLKNHTQNYERRKKAGCNLLPNLFDVLSRQRHSLKFCGLSKTFLR